VQALVKQLGGGTAMAMTTVPKAALWSRIRALVP